MSNPNSPALVKYTSVEQFYPHYLELHRDPLNRRLHAIGTASLLAVLCLALMSERWALLLLVPVLGYGFAWVGHFFIERNRPATFDYPFLSLCCDFRMFFDVVRGRL
jgi:hypothetical protein